MNPTFKRWLICLLLLILIVELARVRAVDTPPAPASAGVNAGILMHVVVKPAKFSVTRAAVQSQVRRGLKQVPVRIVQVRLVRRDVSESIQLPHAESENSRNDNFSKSSQKGALESADARVWIFLCWPGACFLGE